jgi:tetratricopeptide (TPR) repeat protein
MNCARFLLVVAALVVLAGCGDSEASKKRLIETGNKYFASGKFREASLIYRKVIQKDPRYGEAYYRLAVTDIRQGRLGDAIRALRRAVELQPENDDAHSKLGDLYLTLYLTDRNRGKQLLVDLRDLAGRMLKRNPRNFQGLRMQGYVYVADEEWDKAISTFRQANQVKPDDPEVLLALVQALFKNGEKAEAEQLARASMEKHKTYLPFYDFLYGIRLSEKNLAAGETLLREKMANNPKSWEAVSTLAIHYLRVNERAKMVETLTAAAKRTQDFPKGHNQAGDFFYRIGDLNLAREEYEAGSVTDSGKRVEYQRKIVEILAAQGKTSEAVALADKLVEEFKDDSHSKAIRAALRLRSGKPAEIDEAIKEFQAVLPKMTDNPVLRFNLGEAYLSKGDIEQARTNFQEAIKAKPNYIPPKVALGRIFLRQRDFARAQQLADEVLRVNPGFVQPRLIRIEALMGVSDFRTARTELQMLLSKLPNSRDAQNLLALVDLAEAKYPDAEKRFRDLAEATPPDHRGVFGLAQVYVNTNRVEEAKRLLHADLSKKPAYARNIRLSLGEIALRTGKSDEAAEIYKGLVEELPQAADLWVRLGESYRRGQKWDEALKALDKAKELAPRDPNPWLQHAMTLEAAGRKAEVRPVYEQIIKLAPDNAVALNNMAFLLAESGQDLDQALTYAQRAKQQMPNNLDVADTLGWVYIKKNLSDDAIKIFRDLVLQKPDNATWRYHLALALFQKGDKLQAKKELEVALKTKRSSEEEQKIKELLGRIG